jgi:hypothetical protein
MWWLERNCEGCRKYDPMEELGKGCPIEEALCSASVLDGEIKEEIWERMGKDSGKCPELMPKEGGEKA